MSVKYSQTMNCLLLVAAIAIPTAGHAAEPPPCELIDPAGFYQIYQPNAGIAVLDVGAITKELGDNRCSVILDTSNGRVKVWFTTTLSMTGKILVQPTGGKALRDYRRTIERY